MAGSPARSADRLIMHFTHVRNLPGILATGYVHADNHVGERSRLAVEAADLEIKTSRRAIRIGLAPFGCVADYVPFYFAPRSPMLYKLAKGGVLTYTGQDRQRGLGLTLPRRGWSSERSGRRYAARVHSGTDDGRGAGQMREIEVKYRVHDLAALESALTQRGAVLSRPVRQDDQAYAPRDWAYGQPKTGVVFARLRSEDGRCVFTVKKPLDNEMACAEHETAVADRTQMHQAVLAMGFVPTVRIVKTRRTATLGDVALCLDDVEHAGLFFEVEKVLVAADHPTAIQDQLDAFARSLGVALERVTDTYDSLIRAALAG